MRNQYKVLSEKYTRVIETVNSESVWSDGPSTDYRTNKTVNEIIKFSKEIIDILYSANTFEELEEAAKRAGNFLFTHSGKIVPRETPGKPFSSYGGPAHFQSALDLLDILTHREIAQRTSDLSNKYLKNLYGEFYKRSANFAHAQAKGVTSLPIGWVPFSGEEEDVKRALKKWIDIRDAAPVIRQASDDARVNLDI
jgi:hypothetical protein